MLIRVDRRSVAAGDDADPHLKDFDLPGDTSLADAVSHVVATGYLPGVLGGHATWIVRGTDRVLGVVAQQWDTPRFLVDAAQAIREFAAGPPGVCLFFDYRMQADPDEVLAHLAAGREPPR